MIGKLVSYAIGAAGGAIGFSLLINAPKRTLVPSALTAMLGYLLYIVLQEFAGFGAMSSYFIASAFMSVLCEIKARLMRMPSTIFLLAALVPLVPGYSIYRAMLFLVEDNGSAAAAMALSAVQGVAAIAVGAVAASVCFRSFNSRKNADSANT